MWFIYILILLLLMLCLYKLNETYFILALCKRFQTVDGSRLEDKVCVVPGVVPMFGNTFDLFGLTQASIFQHIRNCNIYSKGRSGVMYWLGYPVYSITNAEDATELFQSTTIMDKSVLYKFLKPFLGEGLLISSDQKWHSRRKLLTPAFHFNVLQSFNEVFKEESLNLLKKLENMPKEKMEIRDIVTEFTLNNVIETALGVHLEGISGNRQYRQSVHDIERTLFLRTINPFLYNDMLFRLFGNYGKLKKDLKIAHEFSSKIIEKKREEYNSREGKTNVDDVGLKKRYAMLDTLLEEESKGNIDHQGICDEVNTFMFEGYDTTSSALTFAILNLALHRDVQEKCRQEIAHIDNFSSLTVFDFNNMQYLESVIKETLRLYPSVPFLARRTVVDTHINGLIIPAGSQVNVQIFDIMRDPKHFPDPNAFKPERFLPENSKNRHPFAFVAFSAGSRNCIGQKFAILEMKAVLVALLKNYQILPITSLEEITLSNGIVLRTENKIYVKLNRI